jgi:hypothetical protein
MDVDTFRRRIQWQLLTNGVRKLIIQYNAGSNIHNGAVQNKMELVSKLKKLLLLMVNCSLLQGGSS